MSEENSKNLPRWLVITTAVVGLIAAIFLVVTRYYESIKAFNEAKQTTHEVSPSKSKDDNPSLEGLSSEELRVQGRWEVISMSADPKAFPTLPPTDDSWNFEGKILTIQRKHQNKIVTIRGTYALENDGEQDCFDYYGQGWLNPSVHYQGIYRLEGNAMTVCFVIKIDAKPATAKGKMKAKAPRPEAFAAKPGTSCILLNMRKMPNSPAAK